jgi:LPXTG-site transpeptidase (sortase) family protein
LTTRAIQLQSRSPRPKGRWPGLCRSIVATLCLLSCLSSCAAHATGSSISSGDAPPDNSSVAPAREGQPGNSQRIQFIPEHLTLPGNATAAVRPAATVDGVLRVPENVRHVGWWDGSAWAGEIFGSTVIAGHVDSDADGIGFFARLLRIKVGDTITLQGDTITLHGNSHRLKYRVTSVKKVDKKALATNSRAFQQTGPHRLVLITCTGNFHRDRGGYDSNLVVVTKPLGPAR